MTFVDYAVLVAGFLCASFGLGLPWARRWFNDACERLCAAAAIGLVLSFVVLWLIYLGGGSMRWFSVLLLLGAVGFLEGRHALTDIWRDAEGRSALLAWAAIVVWLQALILPLENFSGGTWTLDWLEHHQRASLIREHWSPDFVFIGGYTIPARPPLANVLVAGFQAVTKPEFSCDQMVLALWGSLVFLPAALLCRRLGGGSRLWILAGLLMLCPSFLQNATFPWTKLATAFFVLTGAYFLLRATEHPTERRAFGFAAATLAAALITHYSAGPYCLVFSAWWFAWRVYRRQWTTLRAECLVGIVAVVPLVSLWFGWSLHQFGWTGTLLTNSTVTGGEGTWGGQLGRIAGNLWATIVPHPLRGIDLALISQPDRIGWFRDYFFMVAQVNLLALPGTGVAPAVAAIAWRLRQEPAALTPLSPAWVWTGLSACVVLGVAVHGAADTWGLAHICLQPLAVITLVVVAANLHRLGQAAAVLLAIGLLWDVTVNIGLHYWLQWRPGPAFWLQVPDLRTSFTEYGNAAYNAGLKHVAGLRFVADSLPLALRPVLSLALLATSWLLWRASQPRPTSRP